MMSESERKEQTGLRPCEDSAPRALANDAVHAQKMEAVGQLAGGIAHDLSNLMTAMFGWLEIASAQLPSDHGAREALKMVDRAARHAVGLTRSLITFSHRTPAETKPIQLNDVLRDAQLLLGRLLPASMALESSIPVAPVWIEGDATQLQQVVTNLALNARDAMTTGGTIKIELATLPASVAVGGSDRSAGEAGVAALIVSDTGAGIADDLRPRIFEPFFTTKERDRGTGLGLSIVDAIVSQHRGWIELESALGCGTTFRVFFPRLAAPAPPPCTGKSTDRVKPPDATILVVEDNPLVRAMLTTVFVDAGYRVLEAEDGEKGQAVFDRDGDTIDVAIVDVDLPKVDGLTVLRSLVEKKPSVCGITITGYPLPEEATRWLKRSGCSLLQKPFRVPELKQLVVASLAARTH